MTSPSESSRPPGQKMANCNNIKKGKNHSLHQCKCQIWRIHLTGEAICRKTILAYSCSQSGSKRPECDETHTWCVVPATRYIYTRFQVHITKHVEKTQKIFRWGWGWGELHWDLFSSVYGHQKTTSCPTMTKIITGQDRCYLSVFTTSESAM